MIIKILQTNLGRCRAAHDLAHSLALRENIDILVVSEPNKARTEMGWFRDRRGNVAVMFYNRNIEVANVKARNGFLAIQLREITIFCAYLSPNVAINTFEADLDNLFGMVSGTAGECGVMGDLNAKSHAWGSPYTDARGEMVCEWQSMLDLVIMNDGIYPTCVTHNGSSFIDVTMTTQTVAQRLSNWRVLQEETLSTHKHILFEICMHRGAKRKTGPKAHVDLTAARRAIQLWAESNDEPRNTTARGLIAAMKDAKREATSRTAPHRRAPYWWNDEVERAWASCNSARREATRRWRNPPPPEQQVGPRGRYKEAKRALRRVIRRAKKSCWKATIEALEEDIWGDGYKIVAKELKGFAPCTSMTPTRIDEIMEELFPTSREPRPELVPPIPGELPVNFSREEIQNAVDALKLRKAPGPDGVPTEVLRILWEVAPQSLEEVYNDLLRRRIFPPAWKRARLVLIPKPGKDTDQQGAYRPLSLIDATAKLLEALIKNRLVKELDDNDLLSSKQFGFRKGKSTIQAVEEVLKECRRTEEKWCVFVALDIKNAFNSVSWRRIMECLSSMGISRYLQEIIGNYLSGRTLITPNGQRELSAGVPQGSVLGPTLWNTVYDGVLRLRMPPGVVTVAYADDLGVIIKANTPHEVNFKAELSLIEIENWMAESGLSLAPQKSEAIVLKGPRKRIDISIRLGEAIVPLKKELKYLGIILDTRGNFGAHVRHIVGKTEKRVAALSRLLPNCYGPSTQRRAILLGVVHSTILYGASIWADVLRIGRYAGMLSAVQRRMLLRVACGYRTISAAAIQVITGTLPISLLIEERRSLHEMLAEGEVTSARRRELRADMVTRWQEEKWNQEVETARWTRSLIPNITTWLKCSHRHLSYELTQVLSGHGCFREYTHRIGKEPAPTCVYCPDQDVDSVEHTVTRCRRWYRERAELVASLGAFRDTRDLLNQMTEHKDAWKEGHAYLKTIISTKESEERARQQAEAAAGANR